MTIRTTESFSLEREMDRQWPTALELIRANGEDPAALLAKAGATLSAWHVQPSDVPEWLRPPPAPQPNYWPRVT